MKLLILLLISFNVFAYKPSEESLLRNNQKNRYLKDTSVFSLKVNFLEELKPKVEVTKNEDGTEVKEAVPETVSEESEEEKQIVNKEVFLKFITKMDSPKFEQILYKNSISKNNVIDHKEFGLTLNEENNNFQQKLFYAVLNILTRSDSVYFIKLMKSIGVNLMDNKDLLNTERVELLQKHKDYLAITKDLTEEEIVSSELKSPLIAEDDEGQEKIDELLKQNWLRKSPNVSLIKKGKKLYWEIKATNFNSIIENETRRVEFIEFKNGETSYNITFSKYLLFQGQYDLPQLTLIKEDGKIIFELNLIKLFNFDESIDNVYRRRSNYSKSIKKNIEELGEITRPGFVI